jgi:hypothetical protein
MTLPKSQKARFSAPDFAALAAELRPNFDFDGVTEAPPARRLTLPGKLLHHRRPTVRRVFDYSAKSNATALLKSLPGEGETWHLCMDASFNGFDLLAAVIQLAGQPCRELTCATLGTNPRAVQGFRQMMDAGTLGKLTVLFSVYFRDADREACQQVTAALTASGATVHTLRIHAKLALFDFGDRCFVAEGSGNLRSCRCVEQVALTCDRELFQFYKTILQNLITNETKN